MVKKGSDQSFEGVPIIKILRFFFLLLIAGLVVSAYYLQTEGELGKLIQTMTFEQVIPFLKAHLLELGGTLTLFLIGFWFGRMSTGHSKRKKTKRSPSNKKDKFF